MNPDCSQEPASSPGMGVQASPNDLRAGLQSSGEYVSLIIRMWARSGNQADSPGSSWRSEVEHIQSGGHWIFSTLGELESFLHDSLRQLQESQEF